MKAGDLLVYKCNQLLAFCKPAGLAVQHRSDFDLEGMANAYAKRKLYLLHRIDQPASGVVLFARNPKAAAVVSDQMKNQQVARRYLALVRNAPPSPQGQLDHWLLKDGRTNKTQVINAKTPGARHCTLSYDLMGQSDHYHLLMVQLHSGRHHQIRAQLAAIGCPIKGDVKYGDRRANADRSIHLHAYSIALKHPVSGQRLLISCPPPDEVLWNFFRPDFANPGT
jgi:23S rRNA pseudouridine1911/1915/1917 synthase